MSLYGIVKHRHLTKKVLFLLLHLTIITGPVGLIGLTSDVPAGACEISTVKELCNALEEFVHWKELGLYLGEEGVEPLNSIDKLKRFDREYECEPLRKRKMLEVWFDAKPGATWNDVARAVDRTGKKRLAESLRSKCDPRNNHANEVADDSVTGRASRADVQFHNLEEEYHDLVFETLSTLDHNRVELRKVKLTVTLLPVSLKEEHASSFLTSDNIAAITGAKSLDEIFGHLNKYWNFFDCGILEYLIDRLGTNELKQSLITYLNHLDEFRRRTKLIDFVKLWPQKRASNPPPGFTRLVFKLDKNFSDLTLHDIEKFRRDTAYAYSIKEFVLLLGGIQPGSVILIWFVPSTTVAKLRELSQENNSFSQKYAIESIIFELEGETDLKSASLSKSNAVHHAATSLHWSMECKNLPSTNVSFIQWPGDSLTLHCLKECMPPGSARWYHAFNKHDTLVYIGPGNTKQDLDLTITNPPRRTDIGYFCCGCLGENPQEQSCCFGVAYAPIVTTFTVTQNNTNVTGTHVGNNVTIVCEAHGYPELQLEITGPKAFQNSSHKPARRSDNWYLKRHTFFLSNLTEGYSGEYTCEATIQVTQGRETSNKGSGGEPPSVINFFQPISADGDTVSFICEVECSVRYNISWLHNSTVIEATQDGKYQQYHINDSKTELEVQITSESDRGLYTCVVNTVYHKNEAHKSIGFNVPRYNAVHTILVSAVPSGMEVSNLPNGGQTTTIFISPLPSDKPPDVNTPPENQQSSSDFLATIAIVIHSVLLATSLLLLFRVITICCRKHKKEMDSRPASQLELKEQRNRRKSNSFASLRQYQ